MLARYESKPLSDLTPVVVRHQRALTRTAIPKARMQPASWASTSSMTMASGPG
jgi:hypothetical protein